MTCSGSHGWPLWSFSTDKLQLLLEHSDEKLITFPSSCDVHLYFFVKCQCLFIRSCFDLICCWHSSLLTSLPLRLFLLMSSPPGQPRGSRHPLHFSVALRDIPISAITRGKHSREVLGHSYCWCLLFFFSSFLFGLFVFPWSHLVLDRGLAYLFTFHCS